MLTEAQRTCFRDRGYVVVPEVLAPDELAKLREVTDRLLVEAARVGESTGAFLFEKHAPAGTALVWRVFDPIALDPYYLEIARHPRVLDAVEDLIGPDIQLHNSNMHLKLPEHGGEVDWHQDFPYLPHTNFDLLNAMIMLDDSTPENGCLNVIPGSHRWGPLNHGGPDAAGGSNFRLSAAQRAVGQPVDDLVVPAGGMSLHHCLVLHSSKPNRSLRPRRALIFTFRAADAVQLGGRTNYAGFGMQLRGQNPHRARLVAGVLELPRESTDPRVRKDAAPTGGGD
jgi:ectoine hydroxylase-related dioxygenase (phytanoyl-CoA dioxygenase family)